jgi:hypothetical protein
LQARKTFAHARLKRQYTLDPKGQTISRKFWEVPLVNKREKNLKQDYKNQELGQGCNGAVLTRISER